MNTTVIIFVLLYSTNSSQTFPARLDWESSTNVFAIMLSFDINLYFTREMHKLKDF